MENDNMTRAKEQEPVVYELNVTGGEPWLAFGEDDARDSVRKTVLEWLRDDGKSYFSYGEGLASCEDHRQAEPGCERCYEAEEDRLVDVTEKWADKRMDEFMRSLTTDGRLAITVGGSSRHDETIRFRMREKKYG